jgi:hypothetical protein
MVAWTCSDQRLGRVQVICPVTEFVIGFSFNELQQVRALRFEQHGNFYTPFASADRVESTR